MKSMMGTPVDNAPAATALDGRSAAISEICPASSDCTSPEKIASLVALAHGEEVLLELRPGIEVMYRQMMDGLEPAEQVELMRLLRKFVHIQSQTQG